MLNDDTVEDHLAKIYVHLEMVASELAHLSSSHNKSASIREAGSRIHLAKLEVAGVEEHICKVEILQREYNIKDWWYRVWNSHIPNLPCGHWSRQLSVHKERLQKLEKELEEMRV